MIGIFLALIELSLFAIPTIICRQHNIHLKSLGIINYFWLCFTVLTAIWELSFIINYHYVYFESLKLLKNKTHVWTNDYNIIWHIKEYGVELLKAHMLYFVDYLHLYI